MVFGPNKPRRREYEPNKRGQSCPFCIGRAGINAKDFYCTFDGKFLQNEKLLSSYPLCRDSTIRVQHRLRAGMLQNINHRDWVQVIAGVARFEIILLPPQLCDMQRNITSAVFLSRRIQCFASMVLTALCMLFLSDSCLNGNFNSTDILFHQGHAIFADTIQRHQFTQVGARNDLARIHGIFQPVFQTGNPQGQALYVSHLLNFLNACPVAIDLQSEAATTFLTNHYALLTYAERISVSHLVRSMIDRLQMSAGQGVLHFLNGLISNPRFGPAWRVPLLRTVLTHNAIRHPVSGRILHVTYGVNAVSLVRLSSNFYKHGNLYFPLDLLDAAFSAVMSHNDPIPKLLQELASLQQPLPDPPFDIVRALGKQVPIPTEEIEEIEEI